MESHALLLTKTITLRPSSSWYTEELYNAKHMRRKLQRVWRKTRLIVHHEIYREQCITVNRLIIKCGVRRVRVVCVVVWCVGGSGLLKLSRGFSSARHPAPDAPVSWLVIFWTASVEPVSFDTLQLSLLQESSTTAIRVHRRGSDLFPTLPSEVYPPSVSLSSVDLLPLSP